MVFILFRVVMPKYVALAVFGRADLEQKSPADNQAKHICKFTYKYASEDCFSAARYKRVVRSTKDFDLWAEIKYDREAYKGTSRSETTITNKNK